VLWILLGVLLTAVAGQAAGGIGVILSLVLLPVYLLIMARVVRPLLGWLVTCRMQNGEVQERALAVVGAMTIASALATEAMGLHYILGAFVAGVVTPENLRKPLLDRLQVMTVALLTAFFFMLTGLRMLIDPASTAFLEIFSPQQQWRLSARSAAAPSLPALPVKRGRPPWVLERCCRPRA
jgi:Kef-type K+ transport system membrane component KefB